MKHYYLEMVLGIRRGVVSTPDGRKLTNQAGWGTQPLCIQLPILIVKIHQAVVERLLSLFTHFFCSVNFFLCQIEFKYIFLFL